MTKQIEMLTVAATAQRAGVSEFAVRRWVREGSLKAVRVGRKYLMSWLNVEKFLIGGGDNA